MVINSIWSTAELTTSATAIMLKDAFKKLFCKPLLTKKGKDWLKESISGLFDHSNEKCKTS